MTDWSQPLILAKRELREAETLLVSNDPRQRVMAAFHVEHAMVQLAKVLAWMEE